MTEPDKELRLKITAATEVPAAAQQSERAIEQVAATAQRANKEIAESTKAATKTSEEQKEKAKAALAELNKPGYGDQIRKTLGLTEEASSRTAKTFDQLKSSGESVGKVIRGVGDAAEGGTRGILGMLTSLQGLTGLFSRAGSLLMGPIGLGLGAAAAGVAYLGRVANQNRAAIEKMFADSAKGAEALKAKYAELEAASEKSLEAQLSDLKKLTDGYSALLSRMDEAQGRAQRLSGERFKLERAKLDRDEQAALAGATTEEQRAKISASFGARRTALEQQEAFGALETEEQFAKRQLVDASEQQRALQARRDRATREAIDARAAADSAIQASTQAQQEFGNASPQHKAAQESAKELAKAADLAEKNLKTLSVEFAQAAAALDAQIGKARESLELTALRRETQTTQLQTQGLQRQIANDPKIRELEAAARAAHDAGDFATQDKLVAQRNALRAQTGQSNVPRAAAPTPSAASALTEPALVVRAINDQTKFISQGSAELVAAQQRNADAFLSLVQVQKAVQEKQTRRALNAREQQ